jgi:hypothetical protein
MRLDKYARDWQLWRDWAAIDYGAAEVLFASDNPFSWFPAATLGHHALEMYLKSALILCGMTVFDPRKVRALDPPIVLAGAECAWGHELVGLAETLNVKRPSFDLSKRVCFGHLIAPEVSLREGFAIFDPFFSELRYPQEISHFQDLGKDHGNLLRALAVELRAARLPWDQRADL